jgi:hypothetical protein
VPLSLLPAEVDFDLEVMQTLLVVQQAGLKRASLQRDAAAMPAPAAPAHLAHAAAQAQAAAQFSQQSNPFQGLPPPLQQQQQGRMAAAAAAALGITATAPGALPSAQHPLPGKLPSPCCTMQHQQAAQPQHLAAYAFA